MVVLLVVGVARAPDGADDRHLRGDDPLLGAVPLDLLDEVAPRLQAADERASGVSFPEPGGHRSPYSKCLRLRTIGSEAATRAG